MGEGGQDDLYIVALSPGIGAILGFIYGPSLNRALARLVTTNNAALTRA